MHVDITFQWDIGTFGTDWVRPEKPRASKGAAMKTLPTWMYGDPAVVVERIETGELRAEERRRIRDISWQEASQERQRASYGLVSLGTIRLIKRARIRELMRTVGGRGR